MMVLLLMVLQNLMVDFRLLVVLMHIIILLVTNLSVH